MKKLLLLSVACFLFAGIQMSYAQTTSDSQSLIANTTVQNSAKEKTNDIVNMFERTKKLDADQKEKIYDIFVSVDKKIKGVDAITDSSMKSAKKAKLQDYINKKLEKVLTEAQYKEYLKNTPK
jgi:enoyl-[acyl-carrier-protein] reductase (NADH)